MSELLVFSPVPPEVPERVVAVATALETRHPSIRLTFSETGGINRQDVSRVVGPTLREAGVEPGSHALLSSKEIDYVSPGL